MKRTACSACGDSDLTIFLDLGESPIADAYTATPDDDSPRYPLQVAVCQKCRLVQLLEVVPAEVLFGTGYSFYSSASTPLSQYHEAYARDVLTAHISQLRRGVLEIGCNDGDMLRHFKHLRHLGVDPSTGPAAAAVERGCDVRVEPFSLAMAEQIRDERGPFGVVIANHVLAHVENVSDCLAGIAHLMDDQSVAMVEVQYLPDLLVNNAFDLVYHEHRNFFSLTSLESAAGQHGLYVRDAELTDRQGGSIRVTMTKQPEWSTRVNAIRSSEEWLNSFGAYDGMQGRAERIRAKLLDILERQSGITIVYGAPAKATTLLNFCKLTVSDLPLCVDTTTAKQGRRIPGTNIPIIKPEESLKPDLYLLAAWNYAAAIVKNNPSNRWLIPFPAPVMF